MINKHRRKGHENLAAVLKSMFAVYFTPLNSKPACSTAFLTSSAEAMPVTTSVLAAGVASQEATQCLAGFANECRQIITVVHIIDEEVVFRAIVGRAHIDIAE